MRLGLPSARAPVTLHHQVGKPAPSPLASRTFPLPVVDLQGVHGCANLQGRPYDRNTLMAHVTHLKRLPVAEGDSVETWPRGSDTWGPHRPDGALRRLNPSSKGNSIRSGSLSYSVVTHSGGSSPTHRASGPHGFSHPPHVRRARSAACMAEGTAAASPGFQLQHNDFPPMSQSGKRRPRRS